MKTSMPRRPRDEDLHAKKTQRRSPSCQEDPQMKTSTPGWPRDEDLHTEDMEMKTSLPRRPEDEDLCAKKT
jgi:hypothetical protein